MNLLIVTQKVDINDSDLGFFHRWLEEFARHFGIVTVICLQKGEYNLPDNVKVLSLGKESGQSKLKYLWLFYRYIWHERNSYDFVFVHMNMEYCILGGLFWRLLEKKILLWYTHKAVSVRLWLAEKFVHKIFTASRESFRMTSDKVEVVGHGIDVNLFSPPVFKKKKQIPVLATFGRIAASKNIDLLIQGVKILQDEGISFKLEIIGEPATISDQQYLKRLILSVNERGLQDNVFFLGPKFHVDMPKILNEVDIFINLSNTGSLDKAVLESMAMDVPVLTSNEAFKTIVNKVNFINNDPLEISQGIKRVLNNPGISYRNYVVDSHNLQGVIQRIADYFRCS